MTTNFMVGLRRRNNELNELTNFLGGEGLGRRMTTNFIFGLGRRNNELNELTNFLGGEGLGRQHCSSLCSQSEGDGYVAKNVRGSALKGQQVPSPGQRPG